MNPSKVALTVLPAALMIGAMIALRGHEQWFASFAKTPQAALLLDGPASPYPILARPRSASSSCCLRRRARRALSRLGRPRRRNCRRRFCRLVGRERLVAMAARVRDGSVLAYADPATLTGSLAAIGCGLFALRVALAAMPPLRPPPRAGCPASAPSTATRNG